MIGVNATGRELRRCRSIVRQGRVATRCCEPRESQDLRQRLRPMPQLRRVSRNARRERRWRARWNLPQPAQLYRSDRSRRLEAQTSLVVSCKRNLCVRSWRLIPSRHRSCSATFRPSPRRKPAATCPAALGVMGKPRAIKNSVGLLQPPSSSSAQPDCEHFFATQIGETTLSGGSTDGAIGEVQLVRNPDLESR
ncbi:unannotated protein [freshwater metagenome]|uniref:Unannotated protein n=1 Tax=freshwater metagenome TaxID=449393 RepID=A0A6J6YEA8_9ZZZZ